MGTEREWIALPLDDSRSVTASVFALECPLGRTGPSRQTPLPASSRDGLLLGGSGARPHQALGPEVREDPEQLG